MRIALGRTILNSIRIIRKTFYIFSASIPFPGLLQIYDIQFQTNVNLIHCYEIEYHAIEIQFQSCANQFQTNDIQFHAN